MKEVPSEQTTPHFLLHARRLISGVGGLPDFGFLAFLGFKKPLFPYVLGSKKPLFSLFFFMVVPFNGGTFFLLRWFLV